MGNLFCVLVLTLASQGVVELTGSAEFYSLGEHALILEDEVGQLSFEQVTLLPDSAFTKSRASKLPEMVPPAKYEPSAAKVADDCASYKVTL